MAIHLQPHHSLAVTSDEGPECQARPHPLPRGVRVPSQGLSLLNLSSLDYVW